MVISFMIDASFHRKLESIRYNAALAITSAIRGTSKEKLYQELGFESLQQRRWYRKLYCFYKICKEQPHITFSDLYPNRTQGVQWGTQKTFLSVELIMNTLKTLFYPRL